MKKFVLTTRKDAIKPQEAIDLYVAIGWGTATQYNRKSMKRALMHSSCIISVRDSGGKLIGLTRVLSDGEIHTCIADIVVHPDYRRQGVGKKMMEVVKKKYGYTGIFISAFRGKEENFFKKCGYEKRDMVVYAATFPK